RRAQTPKKPPPAEEGRLAPYKKLQRLLLACVHASPFSNDPRRSGWTLSKNCVVRLSTLGAHFTVRPIQSYALRLPSSPPSADGYHAHLHLWRSRNKSTCRANISIHARERRSV